MQQQAVNLADGGMVAVLLGKNRDCPTEYRYHPQVQVIDSTKVTVAQLDAMMPPNTVIAVVSGDVNPPLFSAFKTWCSRHRIVYLPRATEPALKSELDKLLASRPVVDTKPMTSKLGEVVQLAEAKEAAKRHIAPRGSVSSLVAEVALGDLKSKGVAELARELMNEAKRRGISTTLASLQQQIRTTKRKRQLSDKPLSVTPESQKLSALETLDHAIDALTKLRDYVSALDEEIKKKDAALAHFHAKMALMQETFEALKD